MTRGSRCLLCQGATLVALSLGLIACPAPDDPAAPAASLAPAQDGVLALPGSYTDQDGRPRALADLHGRALLVAMVFTHCQYACPRTVADLQAIVAALPPEQRGRVGVLLVSFDPARDTPGRLRDFARERGLDPATWTLLHGGADDVRTLAAALGVRYRPTEGGGFAHSNLITALDPAGRVVDQVEGLGVEPSAVLPGIARALAPHPTTSTEQRP